MNVGGELDSILSQLSHLTIDLLDRIWFTHTNVMLQISVKAVVKQRKKERVKNDTKVTLQSTGIVAND